MSLLFLILGFRGSLGTIAAPECTVLPRLLPLDETHLDLVRGLNLKKRFQPVRQQEELVGATLLSSLEQTDLLIYFSRDWIQNSGEKRPLS